MPPKTKPKRPKVLQDLGFFLAEFKLIFLIIYIFFEILVHFLIIMSLKMDLDIIFALKCQVAWSKSFHENISEMFYFASRESQKKKFQYF